MLWMAPMSCSGHAAAALSAEVLQDMDFVFSNGDFHCVSFLPVAFGE